MAFESKRLALILAGALLSSNCAAAQTADHVAAARAAQEKSPARGGACAPVGEDFLGWPADLVQRCEYKAGETPAIAYVLDVKPETLAKWVETACETNMKGVGACYDLVLRCAVEKSDATFVIGGNLVSTRKGAATNMFYRNGVAIGAPANGTPAAVPAEEQEKLARLEEAKVEVLPMRGVVAFWGVAPVDIATKAIELGVPSELNTPDRRVRWLEIVRSEMLAAMGKADNRMLSGWVHSHPITLRVNECPERTDP